ncbi:MAG: endolytic transglycosylase MltG, partial [Bacteroidota bacterium]|nr:endolytic transglycosylase MltG [Bacteroidota bacterium]
PPGPIKAPELWAIDAVLNAEDHNYIFMVASLKRRGYHDFNINAAGHDAAAREYRRNLNKQGIK